MKLPFLFCVCLLFSMSVSAQDFGSDSTITITNNTLYTLLPAENLEIKGQIDAERNYKGYKGAAVGTLIASLISPIVGLIPAIATSVSTPKMVNLGYPSEELFKKPDYNRSYTKKAKKIKSGKVWRNWGIGFGANLVLVLLLSAGK